MQKAPGDIRHNFIIMHRRRIFGLTRAASTKLIIHANEIRLAKSTCIVNEWFDHVSMMGGDKVGFCAT